LKSSVMDLESRFARAAVSGSRVSDGRSRICWTVGMSTGLRRPTALGFKTVGTAERRSRRSIGEGECTRLKSPLIPDHTRFSIGIPIRSGRSTGQIPAPSVIKYRATGPSRKNEREHLGRPTTVRNSCFAERRTKDFSRNFSHEVLNAHYPWLVSLKLWMHRKYWRFGPTI